jgi:short subunit dehydrogenase-like uncharacterized protein
MPATDRPFDLVLFGATGFTGGLTADYLAAHLPSEARLGLAGRNRVTLDAVRDRLAGVNPQLAEVTLLHADAGDPATLTEVARSARVVITTVGPYLHHGSGLVAACAAAGTDYVDLTGEPEFVDRMYLAHHDTAVTTGARLVHSCGFDSVPHDLGVLFTVQQLPPGVPVDVRGVVRTNASMSGGTLHSGLGQLSRLAQMRQAAAQRRAREAAPTGRSVRVPVGRPHHDRDLDLWLIPLPTIDPDVVRRSALSRADYGPAFSYRHYAGVRSAATVAGAVVGFGAVLAAVQVPPLRRAIGRRLPPGVGPSQQRRDRTRFSVDLIGRGGGRTVHTRVSGGDPGYTETSTMLAEAALCLAFDDNPPTAGQVTTATAMGDNLTRRLRAAGIVFEVIDTRDEA